MPNQKITLSKLNTFLKLQCDNLRSAGLDAAEYKDYIIAMLFLKRVNDQFALARQLRIKNLKEESPDISPEDIAEELEEVNAPEYEFFVPILARWKVEGTDNWQGVSVVTENIGDALSIALNALEESNADILQGVLSTTKFNAVNTKGDKVLSDEVLSEMLKDFNRMPLTDDQFEFPDLLGAAYEFLIKYFAESAGKKGGEFYTPAPVVHLMAKILQPAIDS